MALKVSARTDIGQRRTQNQDSFTVHPELGLFVVADGMGGHKGGEIASRIAVDTIALHVKEAQGDPDWNPATVIRDAISHANQAIFERSAKEVALRGMGTTTTALLFKGDQMIIGHVGDSRCYFMDLGNEKDETDEAAIWQLTRDHSLVQEKLRAGIITRDEVKTDQMKNVITRSVGFEEKVNVEIYEKKARPGDVFLLCSDGLSGLTEDPEILEITCEAMNIEDSMDNATARLVESANTNGGDDNITAILVQFQGEPS